MKILSRKPKKTLMQTFQLNVDNIWCDALQKSREERSARVLAELRLTKEVVIKDMTDEIAKTQAELFKTHLV